MFVHPELDDLQRPNAPLGRPVDGYCINVRGSLCTADLEVHRVFPQQFARIFAGTTVTLGPAPMTEGPYGDRVDLVQLIKSPPVPQVDFWTLRFADEGAALASSLGQFHQ